jgi:hypothetical protein
MGHQCGLPGCDKHADYTVIVEVWVGSHSDDLSLVSAAMWLCPEHLTAIESQETDA